MTQGIRSNLAIADAGFDSRGIVIGSATFQVFQPTGCQTFTGAMSRGAMLEYPNYVDGVMKTWAAAINRLEREATSAGAHGVAGVTAMREWPVELAGSYRVQLIGQAIHVRGKRALGTPFLSMLSMEQTLKLLLRGWVPAGIGVGVSALHVHGTRASAFWQGALSKNVEMEAPTEAIRFARQQAEARLRTSHSLRRAEGVVEAKVELSYASVQCSVGGNGLRLLGEMTGTGVVRFGDPTVPIDMALTMAAPTP